MGVGDAGNPKFPFLPQEIALLRKLLARDAPVLGICLGSQLLAAAAGARVYPNTRPGTDGKPVPVREVGWGTIDLHNVNEPALAGLPAQPLVLHWHGDTYDLPPGAVHLASTPVCRHQAFRIGRRPFGLQFHPELERETIARLGARGRRLRARRARPRRRRAHPGRHRAPLREARARSGIGCSATSSRSCE